MLRVKAECSSNDCLPTIEEASPPPPRITQSTLATLMVKSYSKGLLLLCTNMSAALRKIARVKSEACNLPVHIFRILTYTDSLTYNVI